MGKGKAKGWRPPAAGAAASSMLFGSADHLTGDTIASPVQLREEGRAIPKGHPNYGEWDTPGSWRGGRGGGRGCGKGGGKAGDESRVRPSATGSNNMPIVPKSAAAKTAPKEVKEEIKEEVKTETDEDGVFAKARDAANSLLAELGVKEEKPIVETVKKEVVDENEAKAKRMDDAKTEIERRREAMLQREKASQESFGVATCTSDDDAEARRRAVEARRREAEAAARQAEARRREVLAANAARRREEEASRQEESTQAASSDSVMQEAGEVKTEIERRREAMLTHGKAPEIRAEPSSEAVAEPEQASEADQPAAVAPADAAAAPAGEPPAPAAEAAPEAKRPRVDAASKAPGAAMQHGLQGWAARVNALAEGADADPELVKRCRDFVRKRILKAHATGDLHAIAWDEEPLPSVEELMLG